MDFDLDSPTASYLTDLVDDDYDDRTSALGHVLTSMAMMDRKPTSTMIMQASRDILEHVHFDDEFPDPFTFGV
jgi:hypothetical protein